MSRVDLSPDTTHLLNSNQTRLGQATLRIIREVTELDHQMESWLIECGDPGPNKSCGQRLQALVASAPKLDVTKKQREIIAGLEQNLASALNVRNTLVHGKFEFCTIRDKPYVFAQTLEQLSEERGVRHCFTFEMIEEAIAVIRKASGSLRAFRRQREQRRRERNAIDVSPA